MTSGYYPDGMTAADWAHIDGARPLCDWCRDAPASEDIPLDFGGPICTGCAEERLEQLGADSLDEAVRLCDAHGIDTTSSTWLVDLLEELGTGDDSVAVLDAAGFGGGFDG